MLKGEELADAYSNGDILILTSETESYSQVFFEGLASGLPAIVPDKGAFTKLVEHGETGLKYNTAEEFRKYVTNLVENPRLRHDMGKKGRRTVQGRTWEEETKKLINIYRMAIYLNKNRR